MIPYIAATVWHIGPIPIQVWGFFVASGIALGYAVARWRGKKVGIPKELIDDVASWSIVAALVGARFWHVLFYEPRYFLAHPWEVFAVWHGGMAIMGGFLAAFAVGVWRVKRAGGDAVRVADVFAFALPFGLAVGRLGCFLIHDHPGIACPTCFLSVLYPDGTPRLDHGLLLSLNGALMALVFLFLSRRSRSRGFFLAYFSLWYGLIRFALDFLRVGDTTWLGLTATQYLCLFLAGYGGWWLLHEKGRVVQSRPLTH